jgi:hypothetical protein
MKRRTMSILVLVLLALIQVVVLTPQPIASAEEQFDGGYCVNFTLKSIPVGDFFVRELPQDLGDRKFSLGSGVSVLYNTDQYGKGAYCCPADQLCKTLGVDITTVEKFQEYCAGSTIEYGHDGIDIAVGKKDVKAVQPMLIIASHPSKGKTSWGESIIGATRASLYSEEIITFHHHHLDAAEDGTTTTRHYNACVSVQKDWVLATSGKTGRVSDVHLHFGMRRWKNLDELLTAIQNRTLYGPGYVYSNKSKLQGHLDPYRFITDSFREVEKTTLSTWEEEWLMYARSMRSLGIEFGKWDGNFGAADFVKRGEAARWISIAARQPIPASHSADNEVAFVDVAKGSEYFNYVQNLAYYPAAETVINRFNGYNYYPQANITRAAALKMTTLAFRSSDYLDFFTQEYGGEMIAMWKGEKPMFKDVKFVAELEGTGYLLYDKDWYNSYVYHGVDRGFVTLGTYFYPGKEINRVEFSKWLIKGYQTKFGLITDPCLTVICSANQYCVAGKCKNIPQCVSSEEKTCAIGGGWDDCGGTGICTQGHLEQQVCGGGLSSYRICQEDCTWSAWGPCAPIQECMPDEMESQICNGTGTQTRTCDANGNWGAWGTCIPNQTCVCQNGLCCDGCNYKTSAEVCNAWSVYQCEGSNPGEDAQTSLVSQYCSGVDADCNGPTTQGSWQIHENCQTNQVCQPSGDTASCVPYQPPCQDVYLADSSLPCYTNSQSSGTPTLCLQVQQISGPLWQYSMCKQGGSFQGSFDYHLEDDNLSKVWPPAQQTDGSCTEFQTADLSYIPGYGLSNGAGLVMKVASPSGCTPSTCQYKTGSITIRRECF